MFKRRTLKRMLAVVTAIGSMGVLGILASGTGLAASTQTVAGQTIRHTPAVACSYANGMRVRSASWTNGNETRTVYLWYSTSTACVWAVEVHGQPGDKVWVYNKNTGAEAVAYISSGQTSATTGEIDDSGTLSHACMLPHLANGTTGPKTCTTYY
jgi:hypothetical protein